MTMTATMSQPRPHIDSEPRATLKPEVFPSRLPRLRPKQRPKRKRRPQTTTTTTTVTMMSPHWPKLSEVHRTISRRWVSSLSLRPRRQKPKQRPRPRQRPRQMMTTKVTMTSRCIPRADSRGRALGSLLFLTLFPPGSKSQSQSKG